MSVIFDLINLEAPDKYNIRRLGDKEWMKPNWSDGKESPTQKFYDQVVCNIAILDSLLCLNQNTPYLMNIPNHVLGDLENRYLKYHETDIEVIVDYDYIPEPSVVVMRSNDKYEGHAYLWIHPEDPSQLMIYRPRAKVDHPLDPNSVLHPEYNLLEGCKACVAGLPIRSVSVVNPDEHLEDILERLGYQRTQGRVNHPFIHNDKPVPIYIQQL